MEKHQRDKTSRQKLERRPDVYTLCCGALLSVSDDVAAIVINDRFYLNFCPAERFGCDTAEVFIEAYHCRETVAALASSTLMFAAETHRSSASVLGCSTGHPAGGRGVNNSSQEERRERVGIPSQESLKCPFDSLLGPRATITRST